MNTEKLLSHISNAIAELDGAIVEQELLLKVENEGSAVDRLTNGDMEQYMQMAGRMLSPVQGLSVNKLSSLNRVRDSFINAYAVVKFNL